MKRSSLVRWLVVVLIAVAGIVCAAAAAVGLIALSSETGYFSPIFAPDGKSVFVVRRSVRALVTGFGHEFFTPPATVRLQRDRFSLLNVRLADGQDTVVEDFPASPLEGATIQAYHHAIFGVAHVHLRWPDPDHLDYEIAVTRSDTPASRTFVIRRIWNAQGNAFTRTEGWDETSTGMAGDEPQQLHGDLEVIAVPGDELLPCAVAVLRQGDALARALVETGTCRAKHPSGLAAAALAPSSRRAAIEHSEKVRSTYAALVERGKAAGLAEGDAMLAANDEMSRLGLYPKFTTLAARTVACGEASPLFEIVDEQFRAGLFPDIERAIAAPGKPVHKSMGDYITHRDYTTSQQINAFLDAGHASFFVRARGACWRMTIDR